MRYNQRILLLSRANEVYDPDLGDYVGGEGVELEVPAFVMDMSAARQQAVFGEFKKSAKIAYLQTKPDFEFDEVHLDNVIYTVTADKQNGKVWYLEGDDSVGH